MVKEVAAITGGTSGLGKGFVERFTKDGYKVVFCGRNEEAGKAVAEANDAHFIKCDVTKVAEVEAFFNTIKETYGRLDVLINNAGVGKNVEKVGDIPVEEYQRVIDVNLNGAWYVAKFGVKMMEEANNGGRIVNISSLAGHLGSVTKIFNFHPTQASAAHYGVSKHALNGLTQIMALEYASKKIRINAIAPTVIETEPITKNLKLAKAAGNLEQASAVLKSTNPMLGKDDSLPQVSDVTGVAAFLCGPDSKFINGAIIPVDGGESCR